MARNTNWTQWVVSKGEPFKIEYQDRRYRGSKRTVFEVTDTGDVEVNGHVMDGTQNIVGDLSVSGDTDLGGNLDLTGDAAVGGTLDVTGVTTVDELTAGAVTATSVEAADLEATDDLVVGDDAAVGGDLAVTGGVTVTGLMKINASSFQSAVVTGEDGTTPQTQALVGAKVGDVVLAAINITDGADVNAAYENAITIVDEIQQTSVDLTGKKIFILLGKRS